MQVVANARTFEGYLFDSIFTSRIGIKDGLECRQHAVNKIMIRTSG